MPTPFGDGPDGGRRAALLGWAVDHLPLRLRVLAIDKARRSARERAVAEHLLRPPASGASPGGGPVRVVHRRPPGDGPSWSDVIGLSGGRLALVVGAVGERGPQAAVGVAQLRTAVRTLAVLDLLPEELLDRLAELAPTLDGTHLAACAYAVYDPVARTLGYATAGGVPPVLVSAGRPRELPVPGGAPPGTDGKRFDGALLEVSDGSDLLLCTDGLPGPRMAGLLGVLQRVGEQGLEQVGDAVMAALHPAPPDGGTLLLARLHGLAPDRWSAWQVPADLAAVSRARAHARGQLTSWDLVPLADTVELLVSELVTNAIRHAREPITLRLLLLGDRLEVGVSDDDSRLPRPGRIGADAEGGRGLHLVGHLARRWGARPTPAGKVVWFDLALPAAAP